MKTKSKWTLAQKLSIISESESLGIAMTSKKYNINPATLLRWAKNPQIFLEKEDSAEPESSQLKVENSRLKAYLASKTLTLQKLYPKNMFDL